MAALKVFCFLLVVVIVTAQLGGHRTADPNDPGTVEAEKVARERIAEITGVCDEGIEVTKQQRQTVNGVVYTFGCDVDPSLCGSSDAKKTCTIQVVTKRNEEPTTRNESCT